MNVVTGAMREQRRARRDAERARRGAPPRTRFGPRPSGLIREGWSPVRVPSPPESATGARLLGAATPSVLIADRARVAVSSREVVTGVLPLLPPATGPMPASGLSLGSAAAVDDPRADVPVADAPVAVTDAAVVAAAMAMTGAPPPATPPAPAAVPASPAAPVPVDTAPVPAPPTPAQPATAAPAAPAAPVSAPVAAPVVPSPPSGHTSPREPLPSDLFAHSLGLSPANTPAPPTEDAPPKARPTRRSRPQPPRYDEPRRRGRVLLAAIGVVVLAGAGTAAGLAISNGSGGSGPTSSSTAPAAVTGEVASWLSGNIPTDRRIVSTDAALARDLNGNGVPVDTVTAADEQRVGVVVVGSDAPDPAPTAVPAGSSLSVVTLALFESDGQRVSVGQVVQGGVEEVRADLDKSLTTAAAACRGLRSNAAVKIDTAAMPVFEAGDLDLRASTLLALLAQDQPVEVVAAPQDESERRAGRQVRTLVVMVQSENAVRQTAASARSPYSPEVNDPTASLDAPPGSLVLSWPADASATLPLS